MEANGKPSPSPASSEASASPRQPSMSARQASPMSPSPLSEASISSPPPRMMKLNGDAPLSEGGASSEDPKVAALRQQVAELQARLRASEAKVAMWEECMQQLMHCVMLSPDMNDMYKDECTRVLRDALTTVEQVQAVRYVECSFPSVPSESPHIQLQRWESLEDSEWVLRWAPSWSVQVAVEGLQYLQFTLMLRLFDFRVSGRMKFRASPDLSTVVFSFVQPPKLRLKTECNVSWGSVALPLQTYIETVVQDEFQRWVRDNVVAPHELTLNPSSFQPKKGLTDADVEKAIRAVTLARELSATRSTQ